MRSKPNYCYESGCPLAVKCSCGHDLDEHPEDGHCTRVINEELCECAGFQSKGLGFVLGVGDPEKAKLAVILEAPGKEEISFPIDGLGAPGIIPTDELERRKRDYPELVAISPTQQAPSRFLKVGAPIVGKSGSLMNSWVFPKVGVKREEVFVDNTLRCLPPLNKQKQPYPIGVERAKAESCCRHWDRVQHFKPDLVEITLHPAGILREVTPLPLLIKDFEKASAATRQGFRTLVLSGGKAAEAFLGYGDNVTRWRGHYEVVSSSTRWYDGVVARLKEKAEKTGKKKKKLGKMAFIDSETPGVVQEDILATPVTEPMKFKRKRRKKNDENSGN